MHTVATLFNLGGPDLIVILLIVLILFGAKRLPELARGMGQAMNEFNKAKDDMHRQITRVEEPFVQTPQNIQPHAPAAPVQPPIAQQPDAPESQPRPQV